MEEGELIADRVHNGRSTSWRTLRIGLGSMALTALAVAIALWPRVQAGYGWTFWLWLAGLVLYSVSLPAAQRRRPWPGLAVLGTLIAILVLAAWLRLPGIESVPANISIDEVLPTSESLSIARGEGSNVFSSIGWFSMPNLSFAPAAAAMLVTGSASLWAARLASALTGLAGIVFTFALGRRLLGERAALVAAFFMAVSFWHVHNSRTGFPFAQPSLLTALVLYLLVRARQDESRSMLAVAGIVTGLALHFYFPVRILLLLCPLLLAGDWVLRATPSRRIVVEAAIYGGGVLAALGPLLVSVSLESLLGHSRGVLLTQPEVLAHWEREYGATGLLAVFRRHVFQALRMFTQWADLAVLNRSPAGLVDYGTLTAISAGIFVAVCEGRRRTLFLVAWVALTLLLGVALGNAPRASYRLAPAMPALFLLGGFGVDWVLRHARVALRWDALLLRAACLTLLAGWITTVNHGRFFEAYARGDGAATSTSVALREMAAGCNGRVFYLIFTEDRLMPGLDLFCEDVRAVDPMSDRLEVDPTRPATFLIAPANHGWLDRLQRCVPAARVVEYTDTFGFPLLAVVSLEQHEIGAGLERCWTQPPGSENLSRLLNLGLRARAASGKRIV